MKKIIYIIFLLLVSIQVRSQNTINSIISSLDTINENYKVKDIIYLTSNEEIATSNIAISKKKKVTYIKDGETSIELIEQHQNNIQRISLFTLPQIDEEVFYSSIIDYKSNQAENLLENLKNELINTNTVNSMFYVGSFKDASGDVYQFNCTNELLINDLNKRFVKKSLDPKNHDVRFSLFLTIYSTKILIEIKDIEVNIKCVNDWNTANIMHFNYYVPIEKMQSLVYLYEKDLNLDFGVQTEYYKSYLLPKEYISYKEKINKALPKKRASKTLSLQKKLSCNNIKTIANYFNSINKTLSNSLPNSSFKIVVNNPKAPFKAYIDRFAELLSLVNPEKFGEDNYSTALDSITPYTTFLALQLDKDERLNGNLKLDGVFLNNPKIIKNKETYDPKETAKKYDTSWPMKGFFQTGGLNDDYFKFEILHQSEIYSIKRYIEKEGISKDILSKLVGRTEDGNFSMDYLINISRGVMSKKGIIENKDLQFDRTVEEIGIKLMLNSYIVAYQPFWEGMAGTPRPKLWVYVFKLDISREDLTEYARNYWTTSNDIDKDKIDKYKFLKVPVKYIDHTELEMYDLPKTLSRFPRIFIEE